MVALVLGTSRAYDQREKYPTEEDLNQHSPGKLQRMDAGSVGCPARQGLLEQAGLECWQSYGTARIEPQSQGWGRIVPTPALGWRKTMVRKADPCVPVIQHGPAAPRSCARARFCRKARGAIFISQLSLPSAMSGCCYLLPSVIFAVSKMPPCRAPAHEIRMLWPPPFQTAISSRTKSPSRLFVLHSNLFLYIL